MPTFTCTATGATADLSRDDVTRVIAGNGVTKVYYANDTKKLLVDMTPEEVDQALDGGGLFAGGSGEQGSPDGGVGG